MSLALEGLTQGRRHSGAVGLFGHSQMVVQEPLKGAHDLAPFDVGRGAIGALPGYFAAQSVFIPIQLIQRNLRPLPLGASHPHLEIANTITPIILGLIHSKIGLSNKFFT